MIRFFLRLVLFYFFLCEPLFGQDMLLVRKDLQFLTSKKCFGRGYLKHGQQIAADYLVKSFKRLGLLSPGLIDYSQPLSMSVNTFPGKMRVKIDGKKFLPGKDFLVENSSYPAKGSYQLRKVDSVTFVAPTDSRKIAPIVVTVKQKLTWSVARVQGIVTEIQVPKGLLKKDPSRIDLNVDAVFIDSFPMKNICGYFKGSAQPDSFIFFTAHYDHLGGMGNTTFFPGANDNASGVSMLLALARHFKEHPSRYSIGFVLFCGEEAGLLGSRYFVDHSPISLSSIKFLINLDLLGTGDEGITVVNATEFPRAFKCLQEINEKNKYLPQLKPRGKAANSDHYWFTEKNVPCFFIYTMGGIKAYHDVYDVYSTLPLTRFGETYNLLLDFVERY